MKTKDFLNENFFSQLSILSKFDFTEDEKNKFSEDLNGIIEFIGKVKEFDGSYDDTADKNPLLYGELREDIVVPAAAPEQLLANTESQNNCYIIPRVID